MLKNSEWGAVAYLASSIYGAGTNNVSINSAFPTASADADGTSSKYGTTGCGPKDTDRSTDTYNSVTTSTGEVLLPALSSSHIEDPLACGDTAHSYIGNIGVLASTTNNIYGIYDMSGGTDEYVMGNLTSYNDQSKSYNVYYAGNPIKPPYVDLYKESPNGNFTSGLSGKNNNPISWSSATIERYWNNDVCTWDTCGGHALHETKLYQSQSVTYYDPSWGSVDSNFANSDTRWFSRGGIANSSDAGLFNLSGSFEVGGTSSGFRAVLLFFP